jgi:hypothetical protein
MTAVPPAAPKNNRDSTTVQETAAKVLTIGCDHRLLAVVLRPLMLSCAVRGTPDHVREQPTLRVGARGPEFVAKEVHTQPGGADIKA